MAEYKTEEKKEYRLQDKISSALKTGALWLGITAFTFTPTFVKSQDKVSYDEVYNKFELAVTPQGSLEEDELTKGIESYIGVPVEGDYDKNPDLDFRMQFLDDGVLYDVYVHENADGSNIKNLNKVRELVEEAKANNSFIYVRGKLREKGKEFVDEETGQKVQRAKINPFYVGAIDMETGETKPVFTEGTGSPLYTADDYIIDYVLWEPGPVRIVWGSGWPHYPQGFFPSWDYDGDGIPNWRDPVPHIFGPYTDLNHNGVIDAWDISATGNWGWYGYYWYNYHPSSHWWFAHDHWYCHGGWYNWHHGNHHWHHNHDDDHNNRGHYYGPRKGFNHSTGENIRGERQTQNKPMRLTRESRILDDGTKINITREQPKTSLERTIGKEYLKVDPEVRKESERSVPYEKPKTTRETNIERKTYEPRQNPVETKERQPVTPKYERPREYRPVERKKQDVVPQPTQPKKYDPPRITPNNNSSQSYTPPSRNTNTRSYTAPSRNTNTQNKSVAPSRSVQKSSSGTQSTSPRRK